MRWTLILLLVSGCVPALSQSISRRPTTDRRLAGIVVAAPHAGFDSHTDRMLRLIVKDTRQGWVIATGYRKPSAGRFVNVNRPTEQPISEGRRGAERSTSRARDVYQAYRAALFAAGGVTRGPLRLLVEIHGQATRPVIELAAVGFSPAQLRALKLRYAARARQAGILAPVPLFVWPLEKTYRHEGRQRTFRYTASGARKAGALQRSVTRCALHFELPGTMRSDPALRAAYAPVIRELIATAIKLAR